MEGKAIHSWVWNDSQSFKPSGQEASNFPPPMDHPKYYYGSKHGADITDMWRIGASLGKARVFN